MCGIVGYINKDTSKDILSNRQILDMMHIQKHRGPDDDGICAFNLSTSAFDEINTKNYVEINGGYNGIAGFNRLSILDLSENGHQPMISEANEVILLMNGEIYNAFEYKYELENDGYKFKSTTDTEVVLALYLKHGLDKMLEILNGMFAMVIVDFRESATYLIRDRFGIKPMYYISSEDIFAFSSEIKSFKHLLGFNFKLNREKLDEYLMFRSVIDGTLIESIELLKPGYYLEYRSNDCRLNKYFDIDNYHRSEKKQSYKEAKKIFDTYFQKSVQSQLMSDVRLGTQLSGGIDSTLVAMYAIKANESNKMESVSVVFDEKEFSEEKYIKTVTDNLNIKSHCFTLDKEYYFNQIERITWFYESPINHPNTIGIYKLSQEAKKHVTVLLSGEGADEVFGGYGKFKYITNPFLSTDFLHNVYDFICRGKKLQAFMSATYRAILSSAFASPELIKKAFPTYNFELSVKSRVKLYKELKGDFFDKQIKYEFKSYLPDLLIRQDKMSMANSIENRVPFLDNNLVEMSFGISKRNLIKSKFSSTKKLKFLLKNIVAERFSADFAFRKKMGFGIPLRKFMAEKQFQEYINNTLLPGIKKRQLFNADYIEGLVSNLESISFPEIEILWIVLSFEIWAQVGLDDNLHF